jgi:hypothetical protein
MRLSLVEHATGVLAEFARRRGVDSTVPPVSSVEMLHALGQNPRAGKNLGNVVSLLDAACISEDLPWIGRLIVFKRPRDDFLGIWASHRQAIVRAPRLWSWSDADLTRIRSRFARLPPNPEQWWQNSPSQSSFWLERALQAAGGHTAKAERVPDPP